MSPPAENPTALVSHDQSTFNFLGLPAEIQVRICRFVYDSTPWDLAIDVVTTQGPVTSALQGPFPVMAIHRFPPLPSALAQTCHYMLNLTLPIRQRSLAGFTGRLVIEACYPFDGPQFSPWFDDWIEPYVKSRSMPDWVRDRTKTVAFSNNLYWRDSDNWSRMPSFVRKNFYNSTAIEMSGRMLRHHESHDEIFFSAGIPCDVVSGAAAQDMKRVVETMCQHDPLLEIELEEHDMQICQSCTLDRQESTYSDGFVEGITKVEWVKDYVSGYLA